MIAHLVAVARDQILAITEDVFAAMIDGGGEVLVSERLEPVPAPVAPLAAWVDMTIADLGLGVRTIVRTERPAADELTRALLMMDPSETVGQDDLVDAFGELANVVGGNVKSLLSAPAVLSLPSVAESAPELPEQQFLQDIALDWRGHVLVVSLWSLV